MYMDEHTRTLDQIGKKEEENKTEKLVSLW